MKKLLALAAILVLSAIACDRTCESGAICGDYNTVGPTVPSPTPVPLPGATPIDPCKPVVGVNVSGASQVRIGQVIDFDITPVGPNGPLEGPLDYCNSARLVRAEAVSSNLRQVGSASAFKQQFLAVGVGPFSVQFRVEGSVSAPQTGTVTQ